MEHWNAARKAFFIAVLRDYAKYVSNASLLSSNSIWNIEMLVRKAHFQSFLWITQSTFPMLLCSVQFQSDCSGAQTTSNNLLYHRRNFVLDSFCRSLDMENLNAGARAFFHSLMRITQNTFPMLLYLVQV